GGQLADSFMVTDRAAGNAFIRSFHVTAGTFDNCQQTDGIDAAVGNLGGTFTAGMFVCQDQHNQTSGAPATNQNYKMVPLDRIVDPTGPAVTTSTTIPSVTTPTTVPTQVQVPNRSGYWMVGADGRVYNFGDANSYGDTSQVKLNGPVLDSIPSADGKGYYMVASDGGIFTFGDAVFKGSMGDKPLNKPVQSLVPDADGSGYWLVASDGGIFA